MNKFIVYKCTCIENGKRYVGITIKTLEYRKRQHWREAKSKKQCSIFHSALLKYGVDKFIWEVLDTVETSEAVFVLEKYYIKSLGTLKPNGYNLTEGGVGMYGYQISDETRKKMSAARSGKNNPNYGKRGDKSPNFGRKHSEETKQKIGAAQRGKIVSQETRFKMSLSRFDREKNKKHGEVIQ